MKNHYKLTSKNVVNLMSKGHGQALIKKINSKYYNKYTKIINSTSKMENLI